MGSRANEVEKIKAARARRSLTCARVRESESRKRGGSNLTRELVRQMRAQKEGNGDKFIVAVNYEVGWGMCVRANYFGTRSLFAGVWLCIYVRIGREVRGACALKERCERALFL